MRTGMLDAISKDCRAVILVPDRKKEYFIKEFSSSGVIIEGIDMELGWLDLFFRKLALVLAGTKALYIKRRSQYFQDKKLFGMLLYTVASAILGGSGFFLRIARFADVNLFRSRRFENIFGKYRPELVFATDLQNELDVRLLKEAKAKKIKNIGMVRSWDNLTSKGIIRVVPDRFIVQNEIIKEEAMRYNLIPSEIISVVGVPHYDRYFAGGYETRSELVSKFGLDASKKIILFSPIGNRYIRSNDLDRTALEALSQLDVNILVRLPPTDTVNFEGFKSTRAKVVFQETGAKTGGGKKLNEISREDDDTLALALRFCDVVVTGQSTIAVDAAIFDKPVIVLHFDSEPRVYWDSIKRYYDYEYYLPIIKSGGIKFAESPENLAELAEKYLENPGLDREGRNKIVAEQAGFTDGKSTIRLQDELSSHLKK